MLVADIPIIIRLSTEYFHFFIYIPLGYEAAQVPPKH